MKPTMLQSDPELHGTGDLWSTEQVALREDTGARLRGVASLGCACGIFFLDRMLPDFVPVSGLYVVVLFLTTRLDWPRYFWMGLGGCTGLILLDLLLALPGQDSMVLYAVAGAGLLSLWIVGWVLWMQSHGLRVIERREEAMREHVQSLTRELGLARMKAASGQQDSQESARALANLNDALSRQNRELETIISVASHDLRSPLVNVQGFGKELAKACADLRVILEEEGGLNGTNPAVGTIIKEDIPEALHFIQAGTQKMETLLHGVLRLAGLGRLTLRHERLSMNEIISEILAGMEYQLQEKKVTLQVDDFPPCVGDRMLVTQLFSNLLDNAHKYLDPARPGLIRLSGIREGDWVQYCVQDNGQGISPEHQERIFHMFHRLNPSDSKGDGLGLTIVKRIVDRHHGVIKVESFPGTGTEVFISLPAG